MDDPAGRPEEDVLLRVPRQTCYLGLVREAAVQVARRSGLPGEVIDKVELAVDEAVSNAMLHGRPPGAHRDEIEIRIRLDVERLSITLSEHGDPFAFEVYGNFNLEEHLETFDSGGLGIFIIKSFMDEVCYRHHPAHGNELTMTKFLERPVPSETVLDQGAPPR